MMVPGGPESISQIRSEIYIKTLSDIVVGVFTMSVYDIEKCLNEHPEMSTNQKTVSGGIATNESDGLCLGRGGRRRG